MMRISEVLAIATTGMVLLHMNAEAQNRPPTPPLPPMPPPVYGTNFLRTNFSAGVLARTNAPVKPVRQVNRMTVRNTNPPPTRYYGPYNDPTMIPGLVPGYQVGPPVPLAPANARTYSTSPSAARPYVPPTIENVFAYDALVKETRVKPGEQTTSFTFTLTNTSNSEVTINGVRTSCGCTVPKLPAVPWKLGPGASGTFGVDVDLRGKVGILTKTVTVDSSAGYRYLTVRVSIPAAITTATTDTERARNLQVALSDRQAVFRGDCAVCHVTPAEGKFGEDLYDGTCAVCHDAEHRASMVPNLRALNKKTDAEYWRTWIVNGKPGGLMPAWAKADGGPLSIAQIDSLIEYLTGPFTNSPPSTTAVVTSNVQRIPRPIPSPPRSVPPISTPAVAQPPATRPH